MPEGRPGPEPGPSFRWAGSDLIFTRTGELRSLRHPTTDAELGQPWLTRGGTVHARVDDRPVQWATPEVTADLDELESTYRSARVRAVVRHSFGAAWSVRLALGNQTTESVDLDDLGFTWEAPADRPTWALAAGAAATYGVWGTDGRILGGVLTRGEVAGVTADGFELGSIVLRPGARYVMQWEWRWFDSARTFAAHRGRQRGDQHLPTSLDLPVGDVALVTVSADEALVLPRGLVQEPVGDQLELTASVPGTYRVEVRSTGGATRYNLRWTPPLPTVLLAATTHALAAPRNGAGIVVLPDVAAAQVVQAALRLGCDETEVAEEALDLFTARVLDRPGSDPRLATYLCGEYDRTGDVDLIEAAAQLVSGATEFGPGLGLATGHLALARLVAGLPPRLDPRRGRLDLVAGLEPVERAAAQLEAALAGGSDPYEALARLGRWLGAGLTGRPVRPRSPVAEAYATAVLAGVPDDIARTAQRSWAATAVEVGRWTEAGVLADLPAAPAGSAHAWLAVAARTR